MLNPWEQTLCLISLTPWWNYHRQVCLLIRHLCAHFSYSHAASSILLNNRIEALRSHSLNVFKRQQTHSSYHFEDCSHKQTSLKLQFFCWLSMIGRIRRCQGGILKLKVRQRTTGESGKRRRCGVLMRTQGGWIKELINTKWRGGEDEGMKKVTWRQLKALCPDYAVLCLRPRFLLN